MKQPLKRERPPMPPLAIRLKVAERQFKEKLPNAWLLYEQVCPLLGDSAGKRLDWILSVLFQDVNDDGIKVGVLPHALDHDPALILRPYNPRIKNVAARYTPHAHDPDALLYREKANHQQKTTGRRPGAERTITTKGSDIGLKAKFARLEKPRKRPKRKIQSRGFDNNVNRQLTSRPFRK